MTRALLLAALLASAAMAAACKGSPQGEVPDAQASPQAKAIPAPLAAVPQAPSSALPVSLGLDAGPPPSPLRADRALAGDAPGKELAGYALTAALRPLDPAAATQGREVSAAGLDAARKKTESRLQIELAPARARLTLAGRGFVLPAETELRARADRYGFVVLWPGNATYRVAAPGTMRSLLGERRLDVAPLAPADVVPRGEGARRLGYKTRKAEVTAGAASAVFEISRAADLGEGGVLLCRFLLDLMNASPATPLCGADEIPLHAEIRWVDTQGKSQAAARLGAIAFDVSALARKTDLAASQLAAPPSSATFVPAPPADSPGEPLLTAAELGSLRTAAVDVPLPDGGRPDPDGGLTLWNASDELRFVWLDGVPVAWVSPGNRVTLTGLLHGRYALEWRTFLADAMEPPETVVVPGSSRVGEVDGGT